MRLFSTGLTGWKQSWRSDLVASISVAFIAIPLGLGIGLASGVPPLAAVIPCVIGGLIIGWFSGGNIAIHSTPKMLIGVTAAAVLAFGEGDPFQGYKLFLSVVVVAGLVQFTLGLLRLGIIGDLIPATVIKSLLSAVGIIIIAKQIPILLGVDYYAKSVFDVITHLPEIVIAENPIVMFVGVASVIIMFIHPRIDLPLIKAIPGAVWVILFAEFYSYSVGFEQGGSFNIFGVIFQIDSHFLVNIPDEISAAIVSPDFSLWQTGLFWNTVLAVVIVSSIEGILSAKAIDRLDPLKRKTNVNRELSVIGLGTSLSGLIGGLPIIPAIVASSVGVNHNGKTQLMDVFQAVFILAMIVLLGTQLQHIPLAALAGILIHTGYKLFNPSEIKNVYRIGWDELSIFTATLLVTLSTDLIIGIAVGVTLTIAIQTIRLRSLGKLFTILFRPNVVAYEEEDDEDKFHISVKGYSNFLNYPQLKKALDVIPHEASIIVDFSLAEFIDHTVMEHIAEYEENHIRRGGNFEVIGIDTHLTSATHPLATRFKGMKVGVSGNQPLTSRQQKLQTLANELNWKLDTSISLFVTNFNPFHLFRFQTVDKSYNKISGSVNGLNLSILDIDFHQGELHTKVESQSTIALIDLEERLPLFTIEREHMLDKLAALAGYDDIDFKNFKQFSSKFHLKGENEEGVRAFFKPEVVSFMEQNLVYRVESIGNQLLLMKTNRPMSVKEISDLITFCHSLTSIIKNAD